MVDPLTGEVRPIALIYGEVSAKMAMGEKDDPMIIGGVNGARGIIQYSCFGGAKLDVTLEVGLLKMSSVRMEDILINVSLVESKVEDGNPWNVSGSIEGRIATGSDMNKEEQKSAVAISGAFIFDTSVPFFDLAVKAEIGPLENFYMAVMIRVTRGRCSRQGDYVKGSIMAKGDDWKISGSLSGAKFCANPDDAAAVRYKLTLTLDELSFADGMLNVSNTAVLAVGRGPYRSPADYDLTIMDWKITVTADVRVDAAFGDFSLNLWGNGEFCFIMDAVDSAGTNRTVDDVAVKSTSSATDPHGSAFTMDRARINASIALAYGGESSGFNLKVSARGIVSWPCDSFMMLDGSLELAFGTALDFGKLDVSLTVHCHDHVAYSSESIYVIEVIEDVDTDAPEETAQTFDDGVDQSFFDDEYEDYEEIEKRENLANRSCSAAARSWEDDAYWEEAGVQIADSRFEAEVELKKAKRHLEALKETDGYQLCSAKIVRLDKSDRQSMSQYYLHTNQDIPKMYIENHSRKAWELVAVLDEPMSFADGGFKISRLIFKAKAYDKADGRAPVMQKQDLFPDMDLKYYDVYGDLTATADVDIDTAAGATAARAMLASSAALGRKGKSSFSLDASATVNMTISLLDGELDYAWNLTVMLELNVETSQMRLHMRGAYNKPCVETGVSASGMLHVTMPGTIVIENAAIGGMLYCEGTDPRIEAYVSIDSLVLMDFLELEKVNLDLWSMEPKGAGSKLNSLDWKINISGTVRFDKTMEHMPGMSSSGTLIKIDAQLSVISSKVTLESITVHFQFDVTYQGSNPPNSPMLRVNGGADFSYPCDTGDKINANLKVDLNFGALSVAPISADFVYYCGDRPISSPVFEIDVSMTEPFNVLNMFELTSVRAHVNAYKYKTGGDWFTVHITGETNPDVGKLQLSADVYISTKKEPDDELSRGFSMDADIEASYTNDAFMFRAKGRVVLSDECDNMTLHGELLMKDPVGSKMKGAASRLGGGGNATNNLRARAVVVIPCAYNHVDDDTDDNSPMSAHQTTGEPLMTVQPIIVAALMDEWSTGNFIVTDAVVSIHALIRSDDALTVMVNISGKVSFNAMSEAGPSGLDGKGVSVSSLVDVSFGKESFDEKSTLELFTVDINVIVKMTQDTFKMEGLLVFKYPCLPGEIAKGVAEMEISSGKMHIKLDAVIKYFCGSPTDGTQTMTFDFHAGHGSESALTESIKLKSMTVRAALYASGDGSWDVSGFVEGIVVVDSSSASSTAAAELGIPSRESTWRHVIEAQRSVRPSLGVAAHRVFPSSPAFQTAHLGTSFDDDLPSHLGISLSTSFFFDTRPNPPLFNVSVSLDDLAFGCIIVSLKASGTTCGSAAAGSQAMAVSGTLKFDECDGIIGSGSITGQHWCDDGGDHPLYVFVIESNSIQVKGAVVKDVSMSATGSRNDAGTGGGVVWSFTVAGTLEFSQSPILKVPSLDVSGKLAIQAIASYGPVKGFRFKQLTLSGEIGYRVDEIDVSGSFEYTYPCQPGGFVDVNVSFAMSMSTVSVEGVEGRAQLFCDPPENFPLLSISLSLDRIDVNGFVIADVKMHVDMYSKTKEVKVEDNIPVRVFKGSVFGALDVPINGMEAGAQISFSFDTEAKTFHITANLTISAPPVALELQVGFSGGDGCDPVEGDFIDGTLEIALSDENTLSASVRGSRHCDEHPHMMHALGRKPPAILPNYDKIANFLDPKRSKDALDIELERTFPMFNIHGTLNSRTMLGAGLFLESATLSLFKYIINGTEYWTFEISGAVSFESGNPTLQPKPAGMAAVLSVAVAGLTSSDGGLLDLGFGVKATVDASFGSSPPVSIKGNLAFSFPCTSIKGDLYLTVGAVGEVGSGIDPQPDVKVNATVSCDGAKDPHSSFLDFAADLKGLVKNDMVALSKLEIKGSMRHNADSDGVYLAAHIIGEVTPVTSIKGLSISAELKINTSVPLFQLSVDLSYKSSAVDVLLSGSVSIPMEKCEGGNVFSLDGTIVAHLGAPGDINAHAHGSKRCEANATAIYGYTYHVSFEIESTTIQLGTLVLGLDELRADFYAKVIGSVEGGGEGIMSWFGSLNATISADVPGLEALSQFDFYVSAAFVLKESTMSLSLEFGFSYESEVVTFDAVGKINLADEAGEGLKLKKVSADGSFSLKMGSDINVNLDGHFTLKTAPDEDGRDITVFLTSGDETIKVGGVDLGTFSITADRYQAINGNTKEGWKGLLTSDSTVVDTMVAFDTRDGTFSVQASVTLELGPVTLILEAGSDCSGDKGATGVGATAVLKAHPNTKLVGEYRKYCGKHDHGLDW